MALLAQYDERSPSYLANKRWCSEFLERELEDGTLYNKNIQTMLKEQKTRLLIDIAHLRQYDADTTRKLIRAPMAWLAPFQAALRDHIRAIPYDAQFGNAQPRKLSYEQSFAVGFVGNFGNARRTPRELSAAQLNQMVCVEGIATKCSTVRPKVVKTVHFCEATNEHQQQSYHDGTSITGFPTGSAYPTRDAAGNALSTEYGLCKYIDHQTLSVHEMPEITPAGLLPSSVDAVLDDDLVDSCKPGDRIQIVGVYRSIPTKNGNSSTGIFKTILIVNSIRPLHGSVLQQQITENDILAIRKIAKRRDLLDLLSNSIAPSIYGHEFIKKAILLQLLGGVEKNLENGTHIRGDINLLMCGDPSTAKSQLLRFVLLIAPLAINTTGRGSSGVGLTAAVLSDRETGERRLEAGAMVLADRGIVCIDEFDKMSDMDRVAIHEVMEQQTVTIAKAGIHMSLNARCSVLAAANPKYSNYDSSLSPAKNINLPDSLLSRFDLLFIVLDAPDKELDGMIADRVISNHRYSRPLEDDDDMMDDMKDDSTADSAVFIKQDTRAIRGRHHGRRERQPEILTVNFLKKFIEFAKMSFRPQLTDDAVQFISNAYSALRNSEERQDGTTLPVTARTLETLIRLSTAHAKSRLSEEVDVIDCEVAHSILKFAVEHDTKVIAKSTEHAREEKREEHRRGDFEDERKVAVEDELSDDASVNGQKRTRAHERTSSAKKRTPVSSRDSSGSHRKRQRSVANDASEDVVQHSPAISEVDKSSEARSTEDVPIILQSARINDFKKRLASHMQRLRLDSVPLNEALLSVLNDNLHGAEAYTFEEAEAIVKQLHQDNILFYESRVIYKL